MKNKLDIFIKLFKSTENLNLFVFGALYFLTPSLNYLIGIFSQKIASSYNYIFMALCGLYCVFILLVSIKKKTICILNACCVSFFIYIFVILISTFFNHIGDTVLTPILLVLLLLFFYQGLSMNFELRKIILTLLIASLCFAFVFLFAYIPEIIQTKTISRLGNKFGDLNEVGLYFSIGIVTSLSSILFLRYKKYTILSLLTLLVSLFCGVCTGSKGFIICSFIIIVSSIIMFFGKQKWYLSILSLSVFAIAVFIVLMLPIFKNISDRFIEFVLSLFLADSDLDASSADRFKMVKDGLILFLRKPLFGFGNRGYYHFSSTGGNGWSHNNFTEVLVQYGILGFVCFMFPFVLSLVESFKKWKNNKKTKVCFLFIIFFFVSFFSIAFDTLKIYSFIGAVLFTIVNSMKGDLDEKQGCNNNSEIWI